MRQRWLRASGSTERRDLIAFLMAAILAGLVPVIVGGGFQLDRYQLVLLYMMLAIGLNLQFGIAGEFALAQAVAMGGAAYAAGVLSSLHGWETQWTLLAGVAVAILINVITSLPSLRLAGWYLALATLFLVVITPDLVRLGPEWLGGDFGLRGIRPLQFFGWEPSSEVAYELLALAALLSWLMVRNLVRSAWGLLFNGLRDAPLATESLGISLIGIKVWAYVLAAIPIGVAGVLFAHLNRYVSITSFSVIFTVLALASVFLGGRGTLWGPVIGALLLQFFSLFINPYSPYNAIILGAGLLITRIVLPRGVVGALRAIGRSRVPTSDETVDSELPSPLAGRSVEPGAVALNIVGLDKRFGPSRVLNGVDLRVGAGRLIGLVGPNGSGKTTVINAVTGFIAPDLGTIELDGVPVVGSVPTVARLGVRRTFQIPRLVEEQTVRRNIELGLLGYRRPSLWRALVRTPGFRQDERARAEQATLICRWLGLSPTTIERPAAELSLGLQRVVEIGRAVAANPTLVCLDEPAAGLHGDEITRLATTLTQVTRAGIAVLLVEHNVRFVLDVCEEVFLLEEGQVVAHADLKDGRPLPERLAGYMAYAT